MEKAMRLVKEKKTGIAILLISLVLFVLIISLMNTIHQERTQYCSCTDACPMHAPFPTETYIGLAVTAILFFIGLLLVFLPSQKTREENKKKKWEKKLKTLKGDQKKIYQLLLDSGGVMFQSRVVEETGYSKAKVSRALDQMEAKGLVERKRRGVSNAVVLKQPQ